MKNSPVMKPTWHRLLLAVALPVLIQTASAQVLLTDDFTVDANSNDPNFELGNGRQSGTQAAYGALDNTGYLPESDGNYQPWNGTSYYDSATSSGSTFGTPATLYTITAAPEPTTFALMGLGALALARQARRRQL